jgi:hypothetical protein
MILAQATTQPCPNLWTPGEVVTLVSVISTVFVGAVAAAIVKVIEASKNSKLAVIAATAATAKVDNNTHQINGLQQQITQVALNTPPAAAAAPPAPRSPVVPATFTDAQIRAAGEPDCPEPPAAGAPAGWVPAVPPPPQAEEG